MFWKRHKKENDTKASNNDFHDPRLLDEKQYNILCEIANIFYIDNQVPHATYQELCETWKIGMKDTLNHFYSYVPIEVKCGYLSSLQWGCLALLLPQKFESLVYEGLFTSIANTVMAISNLEMDALYVQAASLVRFLYEQCALLLAITIDPEKRDLYIKYVGSKDERTIWQKQFRVEKLEKTIHSYFGTKNQGVAKEWEEILKWRESLYRIYSSLNHGGFIHLMHEKLDSTGNESGEISFNLWGAVKTAKKNTIHNMNGILMITTILFCVLLQNKDVDISINDMVLDENKITWAMVFDLGFIASGLYMCEISKTERST